MIEFLDAHEAITVTGIILAAVACIFLVIWLTLPPKKDDNDDWFV